MYNTDDSFKILTSNEYQYPQAASSNAEKVDLVNLQMVLATSSMNHEYMRKAYEKANSHAKKEELLNQMSNLKNVYFAARDKLALHHPERLEAIEKELNYQKQAVLSEHGLH